LSYAAGGGDGGVATDDGVVEVAGVEVGGSGRSGVSLMF
jgi:hypothetical protein